MLETVEGVIMDTTRRTLVASLASAPALAVSTKARAAAPTHPATTLIDLCPRYIEMEERYTELCNQRDKIKDDNEAYSLTTSANRALRTAQPALVTGFFCGFLRPL